MKVADLKAPERNVRIHTDQQLREFEKSVRMFGQIRPIVVDENNEILAGNGLYLTLIRLGIEDARVYKYDDLSSAQKKKLMIWLRDMQYLVKNSLTCMEILKC